ncbi:unnamed protein product [Vitrella brassicaformis CCMP3155]|uniref:Uncharacterized protein n=1 Tax=Vitrella brassicaformis (strain CCMP3155) TaxID=1169540 RepID=A0A0G4EXG2_VITBC|nr:unnamed protein product [Vitrella brassicaformis CCMP3155]|eukprot:CEM03269.1 unnamed protein product [Vitrella brassicaformis CCMP3155]
MKGPGAVFAQTRFPLNKAVAAQPTKTKQGSSPWVTLRKKGEKQKGDEGEKKRPLTEAAPPGHADKKAQVVMDSQGQEVRSEVFHSAMEFPPPPTTDTDTPREPEKPPNKKRDRPPLAKTVERSPPETSVPQTSSVTSAISQADQPEQTVSTGSDYKPPAISIHTPSGNTIPFVHRSVTALADTLLPATLQAAALQAQAFAGEAEGGGGEGQQLQQDKQPATEREGVVGVGVGDQLSQLLTGVPSAGGGGGLWIEGGNGEEAVYVDTMMREPMSSPYVGAVAEPFRRGAIPCCDLVMWMWPM